MYRVIVERSAEKDLKKLASEIRSRTAVAILALAKNPRPAGSRKLVGTESDYRIVYEIADEIRIVRINRVRHRRDVYR